MGDVTREEFNMLYDCIQGIQSDIKDMRKDLACYRDKSMSKSMAALLSVMTTGLGVCLTIILTNIH